MADRYQDIVYSVGVGVGTQYMAVGIPNNIVNIVKIKLTASVVTAPTEFTIYKSAAHAASDIVYATDLYTGSLVDPVEDTGVVSIERNQGFVCAYEDADETLLLHFSIKNGHTGAVTYNLTVTVDTTYGHTGGGVTVGVPDGLEAKAYASYLKITSGVTASKNNATIDQAEFRAKFIPTSDLEQPYYDLRTVAEGGTFVHDGVTALVITGITASPDGAQYIFTSASEGIWYYAWRLHNIVGWSQWTDGNQYPVRVSQHVSTRSAAADDGPPADWDLNLEDGPASNTVVAKATRPTTHGDVINWFVVQIKDGDTGAWTSLYNGPDVDNMKWNGSPAGLDVPISLNTAKNALIVTAGGFGTAARGDLVLLDVRGGGQWAEAYCQWATINYISGNTCWISGFFRPQATTDMRAVIVKPPWAWTSGGYLGGYAGKGFWPQVKKDENTFIGNTGSQEFKTTAIAIPAAITNPEARAWFENDYSRSDDGINHTTGMVGLPTQRTWTKFTDTRWWIPKWPNSAFAIMTFDAIGAMTVASVNPRPATSNPGHFYGVQGHFTVYPNTAGVLIFKAKFEGVIIPVYAGTDATNEQTCLMITSKHPWGQWFACQPWAIWWGNYRNNADIRFGQGSVSSNSGYWEDNAPSYIATGPTKPGYLDVARPAPGYILEIRIGFSSGVGTPSRKVEMGITTAEYSLNGGAFQAIDGIETGLSFNPEAANPAIEGFTPVVGVVEPYHTAGQALGSAWSAKLTEFSVEQGIIRQFRTV